MLTCSKCKKDPKNPIILIYSTRGHQSFSIQEHRRAWTATSQERLVCRPAVLLAVLKALMARSGVTSCNSQQSKCAEVCGRSPNGLRVRVVNTLECIEWLNVADSSLERLLQTSYHACSIGQSIEQRLPWRSGEDDSTNGLERTHDRFGIVADSR